MEQQSEVNIGALITDLYYGTIEKMSFEATEVEGKKTYNVGIDIKRDGEIKPCTLSEEQFEALKTEFLKYEKRSEYKKTCARFRKIEKYVEGNLKGGVRGLVKRLV